MPTRRARALDGARRVDGEAGAFQNGVAVALDVRVVLDDEHAMAHVRHRVARLEFRVRRFPLRRSRQHPPQRRPRPQRPVVPHHVLARRRDQRRDPPHELDVRPFLVRRSSVRFANLIPNDVHS